MSVEGPGSHPRTAGGSQESSQPTSIGELFARVMAQLSSLVRGEIEYAQAQAKNKAVRIVKGAALFIVAGVIALYALGFLFSAAMWAIAVALPKWAAALIVGGVLLLIAGTLVLVGKKSLDASKKFTVDPKGGFSKTADALKSGLKKADDVVNQQEGEKK